MIPPRASNPKILRSNTPDALALAREVAEPSWVERAEVLKTETLTSVFAGPSSVGDVVVKTMRLARLKDRLSAAAGVTRLMRQWRGWELLVAAEIETPECLALVREGGVETLVMRRAAGRTLFDLIGDASLTPRDRTRAAHAVGRAVNAMDDASVFNRDCKASNIVISPDLERASVIDTVGVRKDQDPTLVYRMLASLVIEPIGLGRAPSMADRMRVLCAMHGGFADGPKARARWKRTRRNVWEHVEAIVESHDDPRLQEKLVRR